MKYVIALALALSTVALAQQTPPDPAFLQKAIEAVVNQRNSAMDQAAAAQASLAKVQADLTAAQARIKELEAKPEEKPK